MIFTDLLAYLQISSPIFVYSMIETKRNALLSYIELFEISACFSGVRVSLVQNYTSECTFILTIAIIL